MLKGQRYGGKSLNEVPLFPGMYRCIGYVYFNSTQATIIWEGLSMQKTPPQDWLLGKFVMVFFLINDWQGRSYFIAGSDIHVPVILVCFRKQTDQATGNKPVVSIPPHSLFQLLPPRCCLEFLPLVS